MKMRRMIDILEKQSKTVVTILGIVTVCLIYLMDVASGYEILFSTFYLIPIGLVAWCAGLWPGALISTIAAAAWLYADITPPHFYSSQAIPYVNCATRFIVFILLAVLLPSLKSALERERVLSRTDPLTGVLNARNFRAVAQTEIERARRYARCFTLVYLDIDNFKTVNDTRGHSAGDNLLCRLAAALRENTRSTDSLARMGGDEFAILLPETDAGAAASAVSKIRARLLETAREFSSQVSFSIGVAIFVHPPRDFEGMIRTADDLMYSAKKEGKDRIQYQVFDRIGNAAGDERQGKARPGL